MSTRRSYTVTLNGCSKRIYPGPMNGIISMKEDIQLTYKVLNMPSVMGLLSFQLHYLRTIRWSMPFLTMSNRDLVQPGSLSVFWTGELVSVVACGKCNLDERPISRRDMASRAALYSFQGPEVVDHSMNDLRISDSRLKSYVCIEKRDGLSQIGRRLIRCSYCLLFCVCTFL